MSKSTGWIAAFLIVGASAMAQTAAPAPAQPAPMAMDCQMMCQKMHASMKAMDDQLQPLVAKMNASDGPARLDAAIAVINELVRQRSAMRESMMNMPPMTGMKDCPMMKQSAHHP